MADLAHDNEDQETDADTAEVGGERAARAGGRQEGRSLRGLGYPQDVPTTRARDWEDAGIAGSPKKGSFAPEPDLGRSLLRPR